MIRGGRPDRSLRIRRAAIEALESRQLMSGTTTPETNTSYSTTSVATAEMAQPSVTSVNPADGATGVVRDGFISTDVSVPNGGIKASTLTASTVFLKKTSTGAVIPAKVNTTGGGDAIILTPVNALDANTNYTFVVTSGLQDAAGVGFVPFSSTFTTGTGLSVNNPNIKFEKVQLTITNGEAYTAVTMGPDGKLYAGTIEGDIFRWTVNADGTLANEERFDLLAPVSGQRFITGLLFDKNSTAASPILWVSHAEFAFDNATDWSSKITRLSDGSTGADFGTVQDKITGLPRSAKDHLTNQLSYGPDGAIYFTQGSMSATGAPDTAWGNRAEHLLSASVLRLDPAKLPTSTALNVKTSDGGGTYNPYAANAALTIYASGVRNAYDLVWHSNGHLYVPTNGSGAGGNTPAGPGVPARTNLPSQDDFLFDVQPGKYYGHPNPLRNQYVLNGGNPSNNVDPAEVTQYPVGTQPDANYGGFAFNFGQHVSPNGAVEYTGEAFGGALKGKLLVVRYSGPDDVLALVPTNNGTKLEAGGGISGLSGFNNPLDITEDKRSGFLYVAEFGPEDSSQPDGGQTITLLRPIETKPTVTVTASDASATEVAGNAGQFRFARTGLTTAALTVNYTIGGTATSGTDYTGLTGSVTIPAGQSSVLVTLTPVNDTAAEGGESATVTINASTAYAIGSASSAAITIADDDAPSAAANFISQNVGYTTPATTVTTVTQGVAYDVTSAGAAIGNFADQFNFQYVQRTGDFDVAVQVQSMQNGLIGSKATLMARATLASNSQQVYSGTTKADGYRFGVRTSGGADLTHPFKGGTVDFAAGTWLRLRRVGNAFSAFYSNNGTNWTQMASATNVAMPSTVYLGLGTASNSASTTVKAEYRNLSGFPELVAPAPAPAVPANVQAQAVSSQQVNVSWTASAGATLYRIQRKGPGESVFSDYATTAGTSYQDNGVDGAQSYQYRVRAEAGTAASAYSVAATATTPAVLPTVTILANDPDATEAAGNPGQYTIARAGTSNAAALVVNYTITGTAQNGTDYASLTGSATIPAGQDSVTIDLAPTDDASDEGSENVTLTLSANAAYTLGAQSADTVTIVDDDALPSVTVSATDAAADEAGPGTGQFTFTRTGPTTSALAVGFSITGSALNGTDYDVLSQTVTFPAGETSVTLTLTPTADDAVEGNETAVVTLAAGAGYTVGAAGASATVTIADEDAPPTVTVAATDAAAAEAAGNPGQYTFTRTGSTATALVVNFGMSGTATSGDYDALGTTVTIPAGQATATLNLTPVQDAAVEGSETAILTLANGTGYALGAQTSATVTIADDDALPVVTVAATDAAAAEAAQNPGIYRVTRTGPTDGPLTVAFNFGSGVAVGGTDFLASPSLTSVTIPAGTTFADVTITPVDDSTVESNESAILTLTANAAYSLGASTSATVTIADNDVAAPVVLTGTNINNTPAGTHSAIPGGYQVNAGGPNISGTSDGLRLLHSQRTGDFDVVVRVESFTAAALAAKAGLMARATLTAGSAHVSAVATKGDGFRMISRAAAGAGSTTTKVGQPDYAAGVYLRLRREGNSFIGFYSTNGTDWTQISRVDNTTLPSTLYVGLATTSTSTTQSVTARYLGFANYSNPAPAPQLATPAGVAAQKVSSSEINVSWAATTGAASYRVQYRIQGTLDWADAGTTTGTSLLHGGLFADTSYQYQVRAESPTASSSAYSAVVGATTDPAAPEAPSAPGNLQGQGTSTTQVDLSWTGDAEGGTLYRIERKLAGQADSAYLLAGTTNDLNFAATGLTANTAYTFRVRAQADGMVSAWVTANASTLAEAPLAVPSGLTATPATGPVRVNVSWSAVPNAAKYRVQRRVAGQDDELGYADIGTPTATTFTDTTVAAGQSYQYRVRAENTAGTNVSVYSDGVVAETAQPALPSYNIGASAGGSTTAVTGGHNMTAIGADIYGTADSFRFAAQTRTGDFDVVVRIDAFTAPAINAKAGLMARADVTSAGAANVFSGITDGDGFRFGYRRTAGTTSVNEYTSGTVVDGALVRLQRVGNTFTGYFSTNGGATWTNMGSEAVTMPATVYLGLAQSSKSTTASSAAQYRDFANFQAAPAPATITWATGPNVPVGLAEAGSIQIGNKLYVFGGYASGLIGRYETRVLNLDTKVWTTLAPMTNNTPITHFGAATDGNFIYVVGGQAGNGGSTDIRSESWRYNIATNQWTPWVALPEARGGGGLALVNGELHFFSGFITDRITDSDKHWAIKIDAAGNPIGGWVTKAPVPLTGDHFGIAEVDGIIYLIGGEHDHGESYIQHNYMQAYNPVTNTWQQRAVMPDPSSHFEGGVQVINGRIVVLGGMGPNQSIVDWGRVYNPATNSWSAINDLPYGRKGGISAWHNGKLYYATGNGFNGGTTKAYQTNGWLGTINNLWPDA